MSQRPISLSLANEQLQNFLRGNIQTVLREAVDLSENHRAKVVILSGENDERLMTVEYHIRG